MTKVTVETPEATVVELFSLDCPDCTQRKIWEEAFKSRKSAVPRYLPFKVVVQKKKVIVYVFDAAKGKKFQMKLDYQDLIAMNFALAQINRAEAYDLPSVYDEHGDCGCGIQLVPETSKPTTGVIPSS